MRCALSPLSTPRLVSVIVIAIAVALAVTAGGCATRAIAPDAPTYEDVAPLLARCAECHAGVSPAAGWASGSYLEAIACPTDRGPAVDAATGETAPLLAALSRDDHAGLLDTQDTLLIEAWIAAGAPARPGSAHPPGFIDPRSADFHGAVLRGERWARMLDPDAPGACADCHGREREVPGATACASCHADEDGGVLACATCHGEAGHPPRDPCFHPEEAARAGAHAAHAQLGCTPCHGPRSADALSDGAHGDGEVQLTLLDPASDVAVFDPETQTCTMSCHDRGGLQRAPRWDADLTIGCDGCHETPPADHWEDGCDRCHSEAHADGSALFDGPLHVNGRVDLGDGSGGCGACHGAFEGGPASGAHVAHARPRTRDPIACEACHTVPSTLDAEGHLDREPGAEVRFSPLASSRGVTASYEAVTGTCVVYCHGEATPRWDATEPSGTCGGCHGLPPAPPHPSERTCSALTCHGGYATPGPDLSEAGRAVHVDGRVDLWPPG